MLISDVENANAVSRIFVNTNAAAAGGVIAVFLYTRIVYKKADLTLILNGALAGLVAITAEPLTPTPLVATMIGAIGGVIASLSVILLDKLQLDDPVGAISVHGAAGIFGVLVVPLTNHGEGVSFITQLLGLVVIFSWVFASSFAVWYLLKKLMGIRVSDEEEYVGLDKVDCGLEAYPEFARISSTNGN